MEDYPLEIQRTDYIPRIVVTTSEGSHYGYEKYGDEWSRPPFRCRSLTSLVLKHSIIPTEKIDIVGICRRKGYSEGSITRELDRLLDKGLIEIVPVDKYIYWEEK